MYLHNMYHITPYPADKILSAKCLLCYNFQCASMSFKVGKNIVHVSKSLELGELLSISYGSKLFAFGTMVASGERSVKKHSLSF